MPTNLQIVWFKRDLRVADHAALAAAAGRGPVVPLYIVEPELWRQPDASGRQWRFARASLDELRQRLARLGQPLVVRVGDAVEVLAALHAATPLAAVHSHQETGNGWTFARDRRVAAWLRAQGIPWHEYRQHGVVRGLRGRSGWVGQWEALMNAPRVAPPAALAPIDIDLGALPRRPSDALADDPCAEQAGGRRAGVALLRSFLDERGERYHREMSSPLSAEASCSRLSPHLAWGTLSMREALQATRARRAALADLPTAERGSWPRAMAAFDSRLHWHCHFIQKLESEPSIEFRNVNRGFDGLREGDFDVARFDAWATGRTGWPFVDACMRSLAATGWINFRMRAMLVAVASWHLWLHWRESGLHLARLFTDYEPGIHYAQVQMQSGVTGINLPRIYNPLKQSLDQDPEGGFIRRWCPELEALPTALVHAPWRADPAALRRCSVVLGRDYPQPTRDHEMAAREARERFARWRREQPDLRELSRAVLEKHGSRRRGPVRRRAPRQSAATVRQDDLFT